MSRFDWLVTILFVAGLGLLSVGLAGGIMGEFSCPKIPHNQLDGADISAITGFVILFGVYAPIMLWHRRHEKSN